mmetsp:Transcript_24540/g.77783  ORF Transcript_24540/g.77783 Transcript_24540/m.77783 type:complete len:141 (-) Transcript_24540:193-615(-)
MRASREEALHHPNLAPKRRHAKRGDPVPVRRVDGGASLEERLALLSEILPRIRVARFGRRRRAKTAAVKEGGGEGNRHHAPGTVYRLLRRLPSASSASIAPRSAATKSGVTCSSAIGASTHAPRRSSSRQMWAWPCCAAR